MRTLFYYLLILLLTNCSGKTKTDNITIGKYSFDFPHSFTLLKEKGIDSYVGKIKGDSINLSFDYGYYTNKLILTPQEYLQENMWLRNLESLDRQESSHWSKYTVQNIRAAKFSDCTEFVNPDYIARIKIDTLQIDYPIILPDIIKEHDVKIDTIQNCVRRIIKAKNPLKGTTGIYLQDLKSYNKSMNSSLALLLTGEKLTIEQQNKILKIFSSVRIL